MECFQQPYQSVSIFQRVEVLEILPVEPVVCFLIITTIRESPELRDRESLVVSIKTGAEEAGK